MSEKLSPERAVRLLHAKAGELENIVLMVNNDALASRPTLLDSAVAQLSADIALVATLLADHMERSPGPSGPELDDIDDANVREMREWGAGG